MLPLGRSWSTKNGPKLSSKYLKEKIWKLQTIFQLYNDDKKWKYSSNPKDILKSEKKNYENSTPTSTATSATEFISKIPYRKKISNEHFNLLEAEISLDEIIKSINFETNNKSPGNDGVTSKFYKNFSN